MNIDQNLVIEHYGVKGMKWGVIHDKKETITKARNERKAKEYDSLAKHYQDEIDKISKLTPSSPFYVSQKQAIINDLSEKKKQAEQDAIVKRNGELTSHEKALLKGAGIALAVLAVYGTYQMAESGALRNGLLRGKEALTQSGIRTWAKDERLARPDLDEGQLLVGVVSPINRGFGGFGTQMNCRRCTYAYEMRRRGYDVVATKTNSGRGQHLGGTFNAISPGEKDLVGGGAVNVYLRVLKDKTSEKLTGNKSSFMRVVEEEGGFLNGGLGRHSIGETMANPGASLLHDIGRLHPPGARGEATLKWGAGGLHSVAWEKLGDKVLIFDTQSGKMFKTGDEINEAYSMCGGIVNAGFSRLDNIPLNESFLGRWIKNAN